ncbi:MAG: DUF2130 domain-containing protein [Candidatus Omnitrophota bacterium]
MEFNCPLCKQPVTEELYGKITGIWKEQKVAEKKFKQKEKELIKQQKADKKQLLDERRKLKAEQKVVIEQKIAEKTKKHSLELEKIRSEKDKIKEQADKKILAAVRAAEMKTRKEINKDLKSKIDESVTKQVAKSTAKVQKDLLRKDRTIDATRKQMSTLQEQNSKQQQRITNLETQLKKETTPQIEGLLYEDNLLEALKKEFPEDKFEHPGKGGDIIQFTIHNQKQCGIIVYECKKVGQWQIAHAEQAAQAKLQRKADFAILVTNASKKGGGGFFLEKGVVVVHPGGALAIASILREQIVKIAQMKLTQAQREEAIEKTFEYLRGPEFKNSLDIVIRKTIEMYEELKKECQDHVKLWKKRYDTLKIVHSNSVQVQTKTVALISGKSETIQQEVESHQFPALPDLTTL